MGDRRRPSRECSIAAARPAASASWAAGRARSTGPRRLRLGSDDDQRQLLAELKSRVHEPLAPDLEHRRPCLLGPPETYPDDVAPASYFDHWPEHDPARMRPTSEAVARRLTSSCAGWERRPTAADFCAAVRAQRPDAEQKALPGTWAVT